MSPSQAILLFIFVTNASVGLSVYLTNSKRSQNRLFLLFSMSLALWVTFVMGIIHAETEFIAQIGIRGASIAGASIPVTFYLFCQAIAEPQLGFRKLCLRSKLILLLSVVIAGMCSSSFFLTGVTMPSLINNLQVPEAHYGYGFLLFMAFFPIIIYRTIYVFYKTLRSSEGMPKIEMQFALIGMTIALPIALIIHLIAIVSGSSQPQQFGPLCIIPMNLVIAYGIATRRILGIERILRQAIAYALLAGFLSFVYFASWNITKYVLSDVIVDPSLIAQITATILSLLSLSPAQQHIHTTTNKWFTIRSMDVSGTIKSANKIFQSVSTIDSLLTHYSALIKESFKAKSLLILSVEGKSYKQKHPLDDESTIILDHDSPLVKMLTATEDTICRDDLNRIRETALIRQVKHVMLKLNTAMATGTFSKGQLVGILLVGTKKGGGIYDKIEQESLQILCNQFAVALENAQMYTVMQDSKIRNEILLDQLVSGVIVANTDQEITLINREARRIIKLTEGQTLGQEIGLLPKPIANALKKTLSAKSGVHTANEILFAQEEESTHIRMGSTYLLGHDKKPMGALLVFTDMTEFKKLEEQVRRTDQLSSVGTLAAGMAHEIKNPLVTIKTFTQLLPERYADDDFRNDFSSLVAHEVARIDGIVNQMLSFSKPTKPLLVPTPLHETVEQTLKLIHEQLTQKDIVLNQNFQATDDRISGDTSLLTQALVNLNLNAVDAIEKGGAISVGTTNCNYRFANGENDPERATAIPCIRLQISDTGTGIKKDHLQKIFDPFFTQKTEGTGMGLSVAHGIIQEHSGVIEVESELGKGTTFYIYIPILKEDAAA